VNNKFVGATNSRGTSAPSDSVNYSVCPIYSLGTVISFKPIFAQGTGSLAQAWSVFGSVPVYVPVLCITGQNY